MIGYAPLVDIVDDMITMSSTEKSPQRRLERFKETKDDSDDSECNYLVMFFIIL